MTSAVTHPARLGILCMVAGMFCISINDMLIKSLSGGYPLHELVLLRSAVGIGFSFVLLQIEGGVKLLRTGRYGLHLLRALLVVFANSALYAAIVAMPLAMANALYFVAPLFCDLAVHSGVGRTGRCAADDGCGGRFWRCPTDDGAADRQG